MKENDWVEIGIIIVGGWFLLQVLKKPLDKRSVNETKMIDGLLESANEYLEEVKTKPILPPPKRKKLPPGVKKP